MSTVPTKRRKLNSSVGSGVKSKNLEIAKSAQVVSEPVRSNDSEEAGSEPSDISSQSGGDPEHEGVTEKQIVVGKLAAEPAEPTKTFKDLVSAPNPSRVGDFH